MFLFNEGTASPVFRWARYSVDEVTNLLSRYKSRGGLLELIQGPVVYKWFHLDVSCDRILKGWDRSTLELIQGGFVLILYVVLLILYEGQVDITIKVLAMGTILFYTRGNKFSTTSYMKTHL